MIVKYDIDRSGSPLLGWCMKVRVKTFRGYEWDYQMWKHDPPNDLRELLKGT